MMVPSWQKPLRGLLPNRTHPLAPDIVCAPFNEYAGNRVHDVGGQRNHIDLLGPWGSWAGDGVSLSTPGYAEIASLDLTAYSALTVVMAVNYADMSGTQTLAELSSAFGDGNDRFQMKKIVTDKWYFAHRIDGSNDFWITNTVAVVGATYHLAATFDRNGGRIKGYVNGQLDGAIYGSAGTGGMYGSYPLYMGNTNQGMANQMNGIIYYLLIYGRVLSAAEIDWLYREHFAMFGLWGMGAMFGGIVFPYVRADVRGERLRESVGMQI